MEILRSLELIDEGETDHKIIAIRVTDPDADKINNMQVDISFHRKSFLFLLLLEFTNISSNHCARNQTWNSPEFFRFV